jgi:hypothetical protein
LNDFNGISEFGAGCKTRLHCDESFDQLYVLLAVRFQAWMAALKEQQFLSLMMGRGMVVQTLQQVCNRLFVKRASQGKGISGTLQVVDQSDQ